MFDFFKEKESINNREFKVKEEGNFKGNINYYFRKAIPYLQARLPVAVPVNETAQRGERFLICYHHSVPDRAVRVKFGDRQ